MEGSAQLTFLVSMRASGLTRSFNPYCTVHLCSYSEEEIKLLMTTSAVPQSDTPQWLEKLRIKFAFGETKGLKFQIYDNENGRVIAKVTVPCAQLLLAEETTVPLSGSGLLHLAATLTDKGENFLYVQLSARNLRRMDYIGLNDPYFIVNRLTSNQKEEKYRSETLNNCEFPHWKPAHLRISDLCEDEDAEIEIEVFDADLIGSDFIGRVRSSVSDLVQGDRELQLKDDSGGVTGTLVIHRAIVAPSSEFVHILRTRTSLSTCFAVDTSRRAQRQSDTALDYVQALELFAAAVLPLHSLETTPLYIIGSHPTSVSRDATFWKAGESPSRSASSLVDIYSSAVSGDLVVNEYASMSTLLRFLKDQAEMRAGENHYHILIVLTDGSMKDLDQCKETLVQMSSLAMSVVFVGVGRVEKSRMEVLASKNKLLQTPQGVAARSAVCFGDFSAAADKRQFVFDVLSAVPGQLVEFLQ